MIETPYYSLYGYQIYKWYTDITQVNYSYILTKEKNCALDKSSVSKVLAMHILGPELDPLAVTEKSWVWWCMLIILAMGGRSLEFLPSQPTSSTGGQ